MGIKKGYKLIGAAVVISLALIVGYNYFSYKNAESIFGRSFNEIRPIIKVQDGINIIIDPRMELLASVQLNSNYKVVNNLNFKYKQDMKKYFFDFYNHKAVKIFSELDKKGFNYDAPPTFMLYLSNPEELKISMELDKYLINRAGGEKILKDFDYELRLYAKDTNFIKFYKNNTEFYKELIDGTAKDIKEFKLVDSIEKYYGSKQHSYNLILSPNFVNGGYGPKIKLKDGSSDIYGIIGALNVKNEKPVFDKEYIRGLLWHEFGHSFINPLVEENKDELNKYSSLFKPIENKMKKQAYGSWENCIDEHLVRAATIRLINKYAGKEAAEKSINYEKSNGFFYIEGLCKSLEIYENNRDKYRNLEAFFPELVKVFKDYAEKYKGEDFYSSVFQGPINALWDDLENKPITIIIPTKEKDNTGDEISRYAKSTIKNSLNKKEVITDIEALKMDLSDSNIVVYGTVEGNLWLSANEDKFPFKLKQDKVIADKEYKGSSLRFITALPNPQNPKRGLVIYTAQQSKDIVNINSLFHGPTDYVVAQGDSVLTSGNYDKKDGKWEFEK